MNLGEKNKETQSTYPPKISHTSHTAECILRIGKLRVQKQFTHNLCIIKQSRTCHSKGY